MNEKTCNWPVVKEALAAAKKQLEFFDSMYKEYSLQELDKSMQELYKVYRVYAVPNRKPRGLD